MEEPFDWRVYRDKWIAAEERERELAHDLANIEDAIRFLNRRYPGTVSKFAEGWNNATGLMVNWLDKNKEKPDGAA